MHSCGEKVTLYRGNRLLWSLREEYSKITLRLIVANCVMRKKSGWKWSRVVPNVGTSY